MSPSSGLHPALAYHLVNTLQWKDLRPLQKASLGPLLGGEHALLLAPTAGGKTEAAFFPVLSRMLSEDWQGLSVIYVSPIKALLNNLEPRLRHYAELVGRRVALWHGDVTDAERRRIVRDPPDLLLTTPESIEVLLVSRRTDPRVFLSGVRAIVVDEIHAFAGDDRGWHLLSVLGRVEAVTGRTLQRIGLSATVGNTEELLDWLASSSPGPRRIVSMPPDPEAPAPQVELDFVGSLENAARVVSRLHVGEKRLVFCDSRARVEALAVALKKLETTTYVSHSSLSKDQRFVAERAFTEDRDCVIVATSTLELGIDVGDLDRVIQIDSPPSVASLLQRMGRTGRRTGSVPNFLMLATTEDALIQAAGLMALWQEGFVESVRPPERPLHLLAQQLMAVALQEGGVGEADWRSKLLHLPPFTSLEPEQVSRIFEHMLETGIVFSDQGILWLGKPGEEAFGRRNFSELLSIITSSPVFRVFHGREELGTIDRRSLIFEELPQSLLLAGRTWEIQSVDWRRQKLFVRASRRPGRSLWHGEGRPLHFEHCGAIRRALGGESSTSGLSRRARETFEEVKHSHPWLDPSAADATYLAVDGARNVAWWTYAGLTVNTALVDTLRDQLGVNARAGNLAVTFPGRDHPLQVEPALKALRELPLEDIRPRTSEKALEGLKFSVCLPQDLATELLAERGTDHEGLAAVLRREVRAFRRVGEAGS